MFLVLKTLLFSDNNECNVLLNSLTARANAVQLFFLKKNLTPLVKMFLLILRQTLKLFFSGISFTSSVNFGVRNSIQLFNYNSFGIGTIVEQLETLLFFPQTTNRTVRISVVRGLRKIAYKLMIIQVYTKIKNRIMGSQIVDIYI